jgi:hypothetical protein
LCNFHSSEIDQVGTSQHHFMVAEIAGDRLFPWLNNCKAATSSKRIPKAAQNQVAKPLHYRGGLDPTGFLDFIAFDA